MIVALIILLRCFVPSSYAHRAEEVAEAIRLASLTPSSYDCIPSNSSSSNEVGFINEDGGRGGGGANDGKYDGNRDAGDGDNDWDNNFVARVEDFFVGATASSSTIHDREGGGGGGGGEL